MDTMQRVFEHYNEALEYFPNDNIVGIFLQGSQNYHLDTEFSDVDTKLIVTPTLDEICFNRAPHSTTHVRANDEHIDFKDVRLMLQTFRKQNLNFLEILFTDYKVINPKYVDIWNTLIEHREDIAHYNPYLAIRAMKGVALEKFHAMEHRYPAKIAIIDKYGYDGKQLSHLVRVEEYLQRYITGETYKECLISKIPDYLIDLKLNKYGLDEARVIANKTITHIDEICAPYTKDSKWNTSNKEVEELLDWAQGSIIKRSLSNELIKSFEVM